MSHSVPSLLFAEIVRELLERNAKIPNGGPLNVAARYGQVKLMEYLLENKWDSIPQDPQKKTTSQQKEEEGWKGEMCETSFICVSESHKWQSCSTSRKHLHYPRV